MADSEQQRPEIGKFVDAAGIKTNYLEAGEGPPIVLVHGSEPGLENMLRILDYFAYSRELVNDELAKVRYEASIEPGVQEAFSAMFPAPRQRWVEEMATPEDQIRELPHETLIVHGRDDKVIPLDDAHRLLQLMERSELHVFGRCGHWTQIEWADDFNALLKRFLSRPER